MDNRDLFLPGARAAWHTSTMYSTKISSITVTVSLAGFLSSPKPYIRLRNSLANSPLNVDCFRAFRPDDAPPVAEGLYDDVNVYVEGAGVGRGGCGAVGVAEVAAVAAGATGFGVLDTAVC